MNDTSLVALVLTDREIKVWEINLTDALGHLDLWDASKKQTKKKKNKDMCGKTEININRRVINKVISDSGSAYRL